MVSALAPLGWLIDPRDLNLRRRWLEIRRLHDFDRQFNLNGPTVGAGLRREVAPS